METKKVEKIVIEGITYVPENHQSIKLIELNGENSLWDLGTNYLIRTVTMTQLGTLKHITDKELVLSNACWVADTGRFHVALEKGELNEVEMFQNDVIVNRSAIIDATIWDHKLPTESK